MAVMAESLLDQCVAVVTGAGQEVGREIARMPIFPAISSVR
jgi:hypothetical protein